MPAIVSVDGELLPPERAQVSVFDRGFLYGDSVYETLRTYERLPWRLDEHLARLERSAARLGIPLPGGQEGVRAEVLRTLEATGETAAAARIVVTRGSVIGRIDLDPASAGAPSLIVLARPHQDLPAEWYAHGVDVAVVSVERMGRRALDPAVKSGNYLNNVLALREARARGAYECLMLNAAGEVTEGSTSNVFAVRGGKLVTPALAAGLLEGVTRGEVLALAREEGLDAAETSLSREDLERADELFLSASLKEVLPVRSVDGAPVGDGAPGPLTRRLLARYRERIAAAVRARTR